MGETQNCLYAKALQIKQEPRFAEEAVDIRGKGESGNSALRESQCLYLNGLYELGTKDTFC